MSRTLTITQTFGTVVGVAQTAWLDTDFNTVATFCNDPASKLAYADDTGGANAVVLALSPAVVTLAQYVSVWFKAAANNIIATTITISPVPGAAKPIKKFTSGRTNPAQSAGIIDLSANDIQIGNIYGVIYQAALDVFILINPSGAVDQNALGQGAAASGALTGTFPGPGLSATGVTAAAYGDATHFPTFTVGPDGRLQTAATQTITGIGQGQTVTSTTVTANANNQNTTGKSIVITVAINPYGGGDTTAVFKVGANTGAYVTVNALGMGVSNPTRPFFACSVVPVGWYYRLDNLSADYATILS